MAVLTLVGLDFNLEFLSLFSKLLGKGLEFEKLFRLSDGPAFPRSCGVLTCCFQLSSSSTRKLFLLVTLDKSISIRPFRLMKSCQASIASLEYWFRSRTISLRCLIETLVINGFFTAPPNTALIPVLRP